jgi:hypothetical protein
MNETLDNLFARCQQLPDADFGVLLSAMMREQKERDCRAQKAAWQRVVESLTSYIKDYGDVIVNDNRDGDGVVLSHGSWTCSLGLIEVE